MSIKNAIERASTPTEKSLERADSCLMHLHIPRHVKRELGLAALDADIRVGRMAIEVLKSWAKAQAKKREALNITEEDFE